MPQRRDDERVDQPGRRRDRRDVAVAGGAQGDRRVVDRVDQAHRPRGVGVVAVAGPVEVDQRDREARDRHRQQQPAAQLPHRRARVRRQSDPSSGLLGGVVGHLANVPALECPSTARRPACPQVRLGVLRRPSGDGCVVRRDAGPPPGTPPTAAPAAGAASSRTGAPAGPRPRRLAPPRSRARPGGAQSSKRHRVGQPLDVGEGPRETGPRVDQADPAQPGRVDDRPAAGQRHQLAPYRRVPTPAVLPDRAGGEHLRPDQGVGQRGLAVPGGAEQCQRQAPVQPVPQRRRPRPRCVR